MNEDQLYIKVLETVNNLNTLQHEDNIPHEEYANLPNVSVLITMQDIFGKRTFKGSVAGYSTASYSTRFFTLEGVAGRITNDVCAKLKGGRYLNC